MVVTEILTAVFGIFILLLPGLIFRKKNIITPEQNGALNTVVVNLTWPCLVISAMQLPFDLQVLRDCGYVTVITLAIFVLLFLLSFPLARLLKLPKAKQYLTVFMLLFANTGFIGLPVIKALYGEEALFYAAILEVINDMLLFTAGIILIQLSAGAAMKIQPKQLLSPGLVGVFIGLLLFLLNIQLPEVLAVPIEAIGAATTPLTMFSIGFQIGGLKAKEILGDLKVYAICAAKLLAVPLLSILVCRLFAAEFTLLEKVLILDFAMPVASAAGIFSQQYKTEAAFATKTVLLSTAASLVTIPLFAILLEL